MGKRPRRYMRLFGTCRIVSAVLVYHRSQITLYGNTKTQSGENGVYYSHWTFLITNTHNLPKICFTQNHRDNFIFSIPCILFTFNSCGCCYATFYFNFLLLFFIKNVFFGVFCKLKQRFETFKTRWFASKSSSLLINYDLWLDWL